jgi:hypothetical protein
MANQNNSIEYCRQIKDLVTSRFIDNIANEYKYLYDLIPVSSNPDTDIQRVLGEKVGEYQAQHHIRVRREFMMEHEVVLLAKFFTERILGRKVENHANILNELLNQINPPQPGVVNPAVGLIQFDIGGNALDQFANADLQGELMGAVANADEPAIIHEPAIVLENAQQHAQQNDNMNNDNINNDNMNNDDVPDLELNEQPDEQPDEQVQENDEFINNIIYADLNVNLNQPFGENNNNDNNINNNGDNVLLDEVDDNIDDDDMMPIQPDEEQDQNQDQNQNNGGFVINEVNVEQIRNIIHHGVVDENDFNLLQNFRDYVRQIAASVNDQRVDISRSIADNITHQSPIQQPNIDVENTVIQHNETDHNNTDELGTNELGPSDDHVVDVISDIVELAQMELEFNYTDSIPVYIEFPKEPVDEGILNYAGPNISSYSVSKYRKATTTVVIDALLVADGVYNIHGVEIGRKDLTRLLMLLSPTFAYNLTHMKFQDNPLDIDLSTTLTNAFMTGFNQYYGSQTFSDCTLLVSGYKFYTHRIILANESEVFKNYYEGNWGAKNNIEDPFVIEADAHLFGKILDFIYTRKLHCINAAETVDLYSIADVYGFKNLLNAIEYVANPIIMVAIRKRLYENHPKVKSDDIDTQQPLNQPGEHHQFTEDELDKMEEVD